jgi:4-hydroxybutyryl-CoA dehydratase/vinylacetyl-CoA-Delta-isomerase
MIRTGAEYIESLRNRRLRVFLLGEQIDAPVDHPIIPRSFGHR